MQPIDLQSGAEQLMVAASAVRPPPCLGVVDRLLLLHAGGGFRGKHVHLSRFVEIRFLPSPRSHPQLAIHSMANPETNRRLIVVVC